MTYCHIDYNEDIPCYNDITKYSLTLESMPSNKVYLDWESISETPPDSQQIILTPENMTKLFANVKFLMDDNQKLRNKVTLLEKEIKEIKITLGYMPEGSTYKWAEDDFKSHESHM